jgi:hypothetical protein
VTFLKRDPRYQRALQAIGPEEDAIYLLSAAALPQRGWYLSGEEPCSLSATLAKAILDDDLDLVDSIMMEHLPDVDEDEIRSWLREEKMPEYTISRL